MVLGQLLYDELGDGCHLAAFGNGRAREQTFQPLRHFRWGVESFDKCIPRLGRQDEMVLVRQVHLSLRASRIDYVLGEVGVAPRRACLDEAGLARGGANVESLRLGKLVWRGVWHIVPVLIVRLLYACCEVKPQSARGRGTSDRVYRPPSPPDIAELRLQSVPNGSKKKPTNGRPYNNRHHSAVCNC